MWITELSGLFCMSSSYTCTTPRRYRQCSHNILRHEPTSADGSCTVALYGRARLPMADPFHWWSEIYQGICFQFTQQSCVGWWKPACCTPPPMGFRNDTVWKFGQGSWMDVWLSHIFFHQILRVSRTYDSLKEYCIGIWKMCHCTYVKTYGFSTMADHLIFHLQSEIIWTNDLGNSG